MSETLGIDAYQMTTLLAHAAAGRLDHEVSMAFFFRKLPVNRDFVVFCGLRKILEHASALRLDQADKDYLIGHPVLGKALFARPDVMEALRALDGFKGTIRALPEGTLAFAGPGYRQDGTPLGFNLYTPLVQVTTDLLTAKLIETPWLSAINHQAMVATATARVVRAAEGRPVLEFGQRRTSNDAAVDASYAAYVGGCAATSNLRASAKYGIPTSGTMDHFYVMAAERPGVPKTVTEREAFAQFFALFPDAALLVDTYDTTTGILGAIAATQGRLKAIRIDSNVSNQTIHSARNVLHDMGCRDVKVLVSDGLTAEKVLNLEADGFGVGENIVCSTDSPTGVGAVAKIVSNGYGKDVMKLSAGSGKATLPGRIEVYRFDGHDLLCTAEEPAPKGGTRLLTTVWDAEGSYNTGHLPVAVRREIVRADLARFGGAWKLVASEALAAKIVSFQDA